MRDPTVYTDGGRDDADTGAIVAPVDLAEWEGEYVVQLDLPGFTADDVDLSITGTTLRITTDRRESPDPPIEAFHHRERDDRPIERTLDLPMPVEEDAVTTSFDDGVLTVFLPKDYDSVGEEPTGG